MRFEDFITKKFADIDTKFEKIEEELGFYDPINAPYYPHEHKNRFKQIEENIRKLDEQLIKNPPDDTFLRKVYKTPLGNTVYKDVKPEEKKAE